MDRGPPAHAGGIEVASLRPVGSGLRRPQPRPRDRPECNADFRDRFDVHPGQGQEGAIAPLERFARRTQQRAKAATGFTVGHGLFWQQSRTTKATADYADIADKSNSCLDPRSSAKFTVDLGPGS